MNGKKATAAALAGAVLLCCATHLAAQSFSGLGALDDITAAGIGVGKRIVNMAFVFTGVVGAIALVPAAIKAFKGEPQSKDAITAVGLGLVAVFAILGIIKIVMNF